MRHERTWSRWLAVVLSALMVATLAIIPAQYVRAATTHQAAAQSCAAQATYSVGSNVAVGSTSGANPRLIAPLPIFPVTGVLSGTLTLSTYTGCGVATSGQFVVHRAGTLGPPEGQRGAPGAAIAIPFSGTLVLSATGTFRQDPAHSADPTYVLVSATVQVGQIGLNCIEVCPQGGPKTGIPCLEQSCTGTRVIATRTLSFNNITGYLRVQAGNPSTAGIVFLPPPDPRVTGMSTALGAQPIVIWGTRKS